MATAETLTDVRTVLRELIFAPNSAPQLVKVLNDPAVPEADRQQAWREWERIGGRYEGLFDAWFSLFPGEEPLIRSSRVVEASDGNG